MFDPLLLKFGLLLPAKVLVFFTALALVFRPRFDARWCWLAAGLGWLACLAVTATRPADATDICQWWRGGCALREGLNPYDHCACLMPPTVLPLFWLLSAVPQEATIELWAWLSMLLAAVLPFLAQAGLRRPAAATPELPLPALAVLSAAIGLSPAQVFGLQIGSVSPFVTLALVLAVVAWQRWPMLAGAGLALASIKATTMMPFLLLAHWRRDWRVWLGLACTGAALGLLGSGLAALPEHLASCLRNIRHFGEPGRINDFTHAYNFDLITLQRALFWCGLENRAALGGISLAIQLALTGWVFWCLWQRSVSWPAGVSLAACLACLVLYHRVYDVPILILPLLHAIGQAHVQRGWTRWLYAAAACAILATWYLPVDLLLALAYQPIPLASAMIVPWPVWMVLTALLCLLVAESSRTDELSDQIRAQRLTISDRWRVESAGVQLP